MSPRPRAGNPCRAPQTRHFGCFLPISGRGRSFLTPSMHERLAPNRTGYCRGVMPQKNTTTRMKSHHMVNWKCWGPCPTSTCEPKNWAPGHIIMPPLRLPSVLPRWRRLKPTVTISPVSVLYSTDKVGTCSIALPYRSTTSNLAFIVKGFPYFHRSVARF